MLLIGNGRRRRRTQAEKAIAVAGIAGVGLAVPLLTATGAHAAPVSAWDRVANCESTNNWSINSGNGFYGGLQFTSSTWAAYGGTQYAPQANRATKAQQISVAEKVLADQGPGAWPVCSVKAGLTQGGAAASVDTGAPAAQTQQPTKPQPQPQPQPQPPAPQSADPSFPGQAGWDAAGNVFWFQSDGGWYWTSHQSVYDRYAAPDRAPDQQAPDQQAPDQQAPVQVPVAVPGNSGNQDDPGNPGNSGHEYTVQAGDSLSAIAQAQRLAGGWQQLYQGNQRTVGGNPDLITPGQVLNLG